MASEVIEPVGYYTAALRALVWSIRETLNSEPAKKVHGFDPLEVDADAPLEIQTYPYVHVMYQDGGFQPAERQKHAFVDAKEQRIDIATYKYSGTATVNIYSNTILERDRVADSIIGAIGIDKRFEALLKSNEWIRMTPNMAEMRSTTANQSWGTPWSNDVITAFRNFTFPVVGEFSYQVGEEIAYIKAINVHGSAVS
jgi:hypothetical protein